jgi:hypothetical protein
MVVENTSQLSFQPNYAKLTKLQFVVNKPYTTIVPVILASDKTVLSTIGGNQQAYPVYLTIGNISKGIRRKSSKRATVLLGYLPVTSFDNEPDERDRERLKGELLHRAMEALLEPLKIASQEGVEMWCADGRLRRIHPILAAYVGDWPEQCDMACTMRSRCPVCTVKFQERGDYGQDIPIRTTRHTLAAIHRYEVDENAKALDRAGLKPWWPFWASLPYVRFPYCVAPDLLHQLHKGMFKSHLMEWIRNIESKAAIDRRFSAMSRMAGMRHFKSGIYKVQQWTGRESKEMEKQCLPVLVGLLDSRVVELARNLLDFTYRARTPQMMDSDLDELEAALKEIHRLKGVIVELGGFQQKESEGTNGKNRKPGRSRQAKGEDRWNYIAKLHMLSHYARSIRELGTPDGYNTEAPEHLHIEYAKTPWRASNKRDAIWQMVRYIQRQEAIRMLRAKLDAYQELVDSGLEQDFRKMGVAEGTTHEDDGWEDVNEEALDCQRPNSTGAPRPELVTAAYPNPPTIRLAYKPTRPAVTARELGEKYGAVDLIPSLRRYLTSIHADPSTALLVRENHSGIYDQI